MLGDLQDPATYLAGVGALIESPAFYPQLSGRDNLLVLARLGQLPSSTIDGVLERVGLADRAGDRFSRYSLGMKQRLGIAAALLPAPSLLILDEPANGLDPAGIVEMRSLIRSLADEGMTIFISSHLLSEIEHICDHVVMIRSGRSVFQGSVEELHGMRTSELVIRPGDPGRLGDLAQLIADRGLEVQIEESTGSVIVSDGGRWPENSIGPPSTRGSSSCIWPSVSGAWRTRTSPSPAPTQEMSKPPEPWERSNDRRRLP